MTAVPPRHDAASVPPAARRRVLAALAAGALGTLMPGALTALRMPGTRGPSDDLCVTPARFDTPLHVPGRDGLMGRLAPVDGPVVLRATSRGGTGAGPALAFVADSGPRAYINPLLVVRPGALLRIRLANESAEPTIAHWHGLAMDTANDGNGERLVAPGAAFDYTFTVRNRAGLYWYHPHPHGATASQVSRGLFGLFSVEDEDEDALRAALALVPGETEIPLVLHERRSTAPGRYAPDAGDALLGWYGDETLVNFTARPFLEVTARRYRLRVLNAANARNFRLAFRRDDGATLPFHLLGTDGGLLERPQPCTEVFVSPAERLDVLVDFAGIAPGGFVLLESRGFDPMHAVPAQRADPGDLAGGESHAMRPSAEPMGGATTVPDGTPRQLLQFRVRGTGAKGPPLPARLSAPPSVAVAADERPLRLGFAKGRWRINDRVYDVAATPIVVARNAVETWLIRNYHTSMPHAMHLHGFQFRVLERETSPGELAPLVAADQGRLATDLGWKDTVLVWPGESVKIAIDFRHAFAGEQLYLFHCHNLEHEDGGMMLRVKVG
jgi:suppressor of ftsI/bilirubin oxidase